MGVILKDDEVYQTCVAYGWTPNKNPLYPEVEAWFPCEEGFQAILFQDEHGWSHDVGAGSYFSSAEEAVQDASWRCLLCGKFLRDCCCKG